MLLVSHPRTVYITELVLPWWMINLSCSSHQAMGSVTLARYTMPAYRAARWAGHLPRGLSVSSVIRAMNDGRPRPLQDGMGSEQVRLMQQLEILDQEEEELRLKRKELELMLDACKQFAALNRPPEVMPSHVGGTPLASAPLPVDQMTRSPPAPPPQPQPPPPPTGNISPTTAVPVVSPMKKKSAFKKSKRTAAWQTAAGMAAPRPAMPPVVQHDSTTIPFPDQKAASLGSAPEPLQSIDGAHTPGVAPVPRARSFSPHPEILPTYAMQAGQAQQSEAKPIYIISDYTGESAARTVRSALSQFEISGKRTCPSSIEIYR